MCAQSSDVGSRISPGEVPRLPRFDKDDGALKVTWSVRSFDFRVIRGAALYQRRSDCLVEDSVILPGGNLVLRRVKDASQIEER